MRRYVNRHAGNVATTGPGESDVLLHTRRAGPSRATVIGSVRLFGRRTQCRVEGARTVLNRGRVPGWGRFATGNTKASASARPFD